MSKHGWTPRALRMKAGLAELDRGEVTRTELAEREGLSTSALAYWRRRLKDLASEEEGRSSEEGMFLPVRITSSAGAAVFEIGTHRGYSVRVPVGFDAGELRRVLGALESC